MHSAPRFFVACVALIATSTALAACGDAEPPSTGSTGAGSTSPPPAVTLGPPGPPGASGSAGAFGGTDLAWVEINIAMDEELLPLLDLVPAQSSSTEVKALAVEVRAFHDQELTVLRRLHDQGKLPAENPHKGMPMPGMVTPDKVTAAAVVKGAAFDALLFKHLREHMDQGVKLAESERKAGIEPQTLALAKQVLDNRAKFRPRVEDTPTP